MARPSNNLTDTGFLEAALEGLLLQKERIETQIQEVRSLLGRKRPASNGNSLRPVTNSPVTRNRRPLSEAARKRIAAAQKKRWAEYRRQHRTTAE